MTAQAYALNVAMREYIPAEAKQLMGTYQQVTALGSRLMRNPRKFPGGASSQGNIRGGTVSYRGLPGGAHGKGDTFTNTSRDSEQPLFFDIKFMRVPIVFNKLDMWVFNAGPDMIYNMLDEKMKKGIETMGLMTEIAGFLPGQGVSWARNVGGLTDICNDGTTAGSFGTTCTTFGGLSRTSGEPWNRAVQGRVQTVNAAISKNRLFKSFRDSSKLPGANVMGLTTNNVITFVESRFQSQQQFVNQNDPDCGFPGVKIHNSTLVATDYCPGQYISGSSATTGDPVAYDYTVETTKAGAVVTTPLTAYPTVTGESMFVLDFNDKYLHAYRSTHPVMAMGFDDFIPNPDDDELVGAFRLAWCLGAVDNRRQLELTQILA